MNRTTTAKTLRWLLLPLPSRNCTRPANLTSSPHIALRKQNITTVTDTTSSSPVPGETTPQAAQPQNTTTNIPFSKRSEFTYDHATSWFPGHMAKGLLDIERRLGQVDIVIEARDARIPLSSINPKFEDLIRDKDRLIIYNKSDLADRSNQKDVIDALARHREQKVMFTTLQNRGSRTVKSIIDYAAAKALSDPVMFPDVTIMVVGMPNVGKTSLINLLRNYGLGRRKTLQTGAQPGVTRTVHQKVKVLDSPPIYIIDTPGVMIPHIPDPLGSLKVALTGGIRDHLADEEIMADYLLYSLNQRSNLSYVSRYALDRPTDDITEFLESIAKKYIALGKGGLPDLRAAATFLLKDYRAGRLGSFTLDDVRPEALVEFLEPTPGEGVIGNANENEGGIETKAAAAVSSSSSRASGMSRNQMAKAKKLMFAKKKEQRARARASRNDG